MERISTGVEGLDKMLNGGLPKGRTVLVAGHCGSGKTVLASHFIYNGFEKGEPGVYVTFEQAKEKLLEDANEIGIDFAKMESKNKVRVIGGHMGKIYRFKLRTNAKALNIIEEIQEVIQEIKAKRIVIDSINLFAMLFSDDSERRNAVAALISMIEESKCTALLTCEVPEDTHKISWYGFEDFVVDGVLFLHRHDIEGIYQRAVSIVKMRGVSHAHNVAAMDITSKGMTVYEQEPDFVRRGSKA